MIKIGEHEVILKDTLTVRDSLEFSRLNTKRVNNEIDDLDIGNAMLMTFIIEIDGKKDKKEIEKHILDGGVSIDDYALLIEKTTKHFKDLQKKNEK